MPIRDDSGWRFQVRTDSGTALSLLTDEDAEGLEACHAGPWVRSWHEALDQLETSYPYWRITVPLRVEPAFRAWRKRSEHGASPACARRFENEPVKRDEPRALKLRP